MKTLGIVAHSAEGGTLCFISACREGQKLLGPHMHPEIVVSAIPMASSMPGWADLFVRVIEHLRAAGADCVILGCTEIPLIITGENSPLPILDSTRLLAKHAVREAADDRPLTPGGHWITRSAGRSPQPMAAGAAERDQAHSA